jgi:hypothetical protein
MINFYGNLLLSFWMGCWIEANIASGQEWNSIDSLTERRIVM